MEIRNLDEGVLMLVSDTGYTWKKRFVIGKYGDMFLAHSNAEIEEDINYNLEPTLWKLIKPLENE